MGRGAAELVVHGLLAAAVVALVVRLPTHREPALRLAAWRLGLLASVVLSPLYGLVFPSRIGDAFRDRWALLSGGRWTGVAWHGHALSGVVLVLAVVLGTVLFLRDLVPSVLDAFAPRSRGAGPLPPALVAAAERARQALGLESPRLRLEGTSRHVLVCRGLCNPVIVVSTAVVEALDVDELVAALAHEMCHVRRRDPVWGALLMLVRTVLFFSPGIQIAARALISEMETRADDGAARAVGDGALVARSLRKLADPLAPGAGAWDRLQRGAIERRCARLLAPARMPVAARAGLLAMAGGLALLLFFTVV